MANNKENHHNENNHFQQTSPENEEIDLFINQTFNYPINNTITDFHQ